MPGRVQEDARSGPGLVLMFGRAKTKHGHLAGIEVVNDHVEVHLLGHLLTGPHRR